MVALRTGWPPAPSCSSNRLRKPGSPTPTAPWPTRCVPGGWWGTPDSVAAQVTALAAEHAVDEVMVHPVAGALAQTPADRAPAREATLSLLAEAFGQRAA